MNNEIAIDNALNYNSIRSIKNILKNWESIQYKRTQANSTAICIHLDIINALKKCTLKQRQCIFYYYMNRETLYQVGNRLNISQKTVHSIIQSTLKKMKEKLN